MTIYKEAFAYFVISSHVHFFKKSVLQNFSLVLI